MGCGCCSDEGLGRKAEVARGGWAEDARRRPATSLVSALIALLGTWGEGQHSILAREQSGLSLVQLAHVRSEEAQGSAIGTRSSLS